MCFTNGQWLQMNMTTRGLPLKSLSETCLLVTSRSENAGAAAPNFRILVEGVLAMTQLSVVVLVAEVSDLVFTLHPPQHVLHFNELNEEVVLRVQTGRRLRALVEERHPLLHALEARAAGQVHHQCQVEHNGRGQDGVAAEE